MSNKCMYATICLNIAVCALTCFLSIVCYCMSYSITVVYSDPERWRLYVKLCVGFISIFSLKFVALTNVLRRAPTGISLVDVFP